MQTAQREYPFCQRDGLNIARIRRLGAQTVKERRLVNTYDDHDECIWRKEEGRRLLYILRPMRGEVLEEFHDDPHTGHPGRKETFRSICQRYWWKQIAADVREWVRTYTICTTIKPGPAAEKVPLRPRVPTEPWQTVSLDVLGPFDDAPPSHRYLMVNGHLYTMGRGQASVSSPS